MWSFSSQSSCFQCTRNPTTRGSSSQSFLTLNSKIRGPVEIITPRSWKNKTLRIKRQLNRDKIRKQVWVSFKKWWIPSKLDKGLSWICSNTNCELCSVLVLNSKLRLRWANKCMTKHYINLAKPSTSWRCRSLWWCSQCSRVLSSNGIKEKRLLRYLDLWSAIRKTLRCHRIIHCSWKRH